MTELVVPFNPTTRTRGRTWQRAAAAKRRYPARVARQLALAHALQRRVDRGEFADYADLARGLGFTQAHITQLMNLPLIATTSRRRSSSSRSRPAASRSPSTPSATPCSPPSTGANSGSGGMHFGWGSSPAEVAEAMRGHLFSAPDP